MCNVRLFTLKAGYVSGMLAPVGIGIVGALLIVGALYGIRMIHRKRRNNLKHQRRKVSEAGKHKMLLLCINFVYGAYLVYISYIVYISYMSTHLVVVDYSNLQKLEVDQTKQCC